MGNEAQIDDSFWLEYNPPQRQQTNLIHRLEDRARRNPHMRHFKLCHADLHGINLVNHGSKQGYDFRGADFYKANLRDAHLFAASLRHCSLMKADFSGANLHCADLRGANLLGIKLHGARLDNVQWGKQVLQEVKAYKAERAGEMETARDLFEQAEEIYRTLRINLEQEGLFETAGYFFHREMVMRRKQMPRTSATRWISKLMDIFCGYGEKPLRVIAFSIGMIALCACVYFLFGIEYQGQLLQLSFQDGLLTNLKSLLMSIYFSIVTFTTLGYGDVTPTGITRGLAATEAFCGSFTIALFVVVFVKKMTR